MGEKGDKQLIQQLSHTSLYKDYERAFSAATGMPLALRGVEHWQMALHGKQNENPFSNRPPHFVRRCRRLVRHRRARRGKARIA